MRSAYRESLDSFSYDLILLCDEVENMLSLASQALLKVDNNAAQHALSHSESLEEIRTRCEERALHLLALENPLAKDLRQVVSSIYIVEDFYRMGQLAQHIAAIANRRYPSPALPQQYRGFFEELARLNTTMVHSTRDILANPHPDIALTLAREDDAVDDIHAHLMHTLTHRSWPHSTTQAVDMAMLSRFYERFGDHCVNVASRIIFFTTGLQPTAYKARKEKEALEADIEARFAELERQFRP